MTISFNLKNLTLTAPAILLALVSGCATESVGDDDSDDSTATMDTASDGDPRVPYLSNTPLCGTYMRHVGLCGAWFEQPYWGSPTGVVCTYQVYDVSYYSNGYGGPVQRTYQYGVPCAVKFGGVSKGDTCPKPACRI